MDMEKFKEMLLKKKQEQKGKVDSSKLEAKANLMKSLSDEIGSDISKELTGVNKVTVASDSEEGLKDGLEKAEDILEGKENKESEDESEQEDMEESSDDVNSQIAELEKKLEELKKRA